MSAVTLGGIRPGCMDTSQRRSGLAMIRRNFLKSAVQVAAGAGALGSQRMIVASAAPDKPCAAILPRMTDVTKYVSDFAVNAKYSDVPSDVVELGKKSILDSLGLALAGSR